MASSDTRHSYAVSIEAVGFHYTKSLVAKVGMTVGLATDPADMLNEVLPPALPAVCVACLELIACVLPCSIMAAAGSMLAAGCCFLSGRRGPYEA